MATDIEFSSCSSSLVDSGFESPPPIPPPRKKRSKSTWSLVEKDIDRFESYSGCDRKSGSKGFSVFLKNFAPSAREKLKQSFWTLVTSAWDEATFATELLIFIGLICFPDDDSDKSTALRGGMVSRCFASRRSREASQTRRWLFGEGNDEKRWKSDRIKRLLERAQTFHRTNYGWGVWWRNWFYFLRWKFLFSSLAFSRVIIASKGRAFQVFKNWFCTSTSQKHRSPVEVALY